MQKNDSRGSIYLIYSSSRLTREEISDSELHEPDEVWGQLELFTSEKPDAVIIAQPDRLGFEGISQIIANGHARRIFDLREMPFISFGDETRERFLKVLERNKVEYFNIFKLRHKLCDKEGQVGDIDTSDLSFAQCEVKKILKPMIETGPTVIFSDMDPAIDESVKKLLDLLSRSSIPYSPVFAESHKQRVSVNA